MPIKSMVLGEVKKFFCENRVISLQPLQILPIFRGFSLVKLYKYSYTIYNFFESPGKINVFQINEKVISVIEFSLINIQNPLEWI